MHNYDSFFISCLHVGLDDYMLMQYKPYTENTGRHLNFSKFAMSKTACILGCNAKNCMHSWFLLEIKKIFTYQNSQLLLQTSAVVYNYYQKRIKHCNASPTVKNEVPTKPSIFLCSVPVQDICCQVDVDIHTAAIKMHHR
jgi:hypothetical protein